ncbi:MAG: response regulator [Bacteroidia bacterium]|nr:response regulator [Bacteroidia bacterium]
MENQKYPLIFIVEDNTVYNKLIVNHLRLHKLTRTESFLRGEDCLKNIDRKPDIIIQDYLLDGMTGIDVLKATRKKYPETEFIFLSGQNDIELAINSMKYGACDYIIKDQYALKKLTDKIGKIITIHELIISNKRYKLGITLFFIALSVIILIFASLAFFFPKTFSFL